LVTGSVTAVTGITGLDRLSDGYQPGVFKFFGF
jgi:hypothetical protein